MGLHTNRQRIAARAESTGLIGKGVLGDPTTLITVNNARAVVAATRPAGPGVEVNFEITGHGLVATQTFIPVGFTPAAYDGAFTVKAVVDVDNITVDLLSDPGGDATVIGTFDDGTLNINHAGNYQVVKPIDQFNFVMKAFGRSWAPVSNLDHTAVGADGNFVIIVDETGVISIDELPSGSAKLLAFEGTGIANFNSHVQIGSITKAGNVINSFVPVLSTTNNIHNKHRYFLDSVGVLNNKNNPQAIEFAGASLELVYKAGDSLLTDIGFTDTGGVSPDQDILAADLNPATLVLVTRDDVIQAVTLDIDVVNIESPVGTIVAMSNSTAANRFVLGFADELFIAYLLGQTDYAGGSALADAANAGEAVDNPSLTILGVLMDQISLMKNETDLTANATLTVLSRFF